MKNYRRISVIVGLLFIIGTISGISSVVFTNSLIQFPDIMKKVSENEFQMYIGTVFVLMMGFSLALVPFFLYPILKKQNQTLAIGYVVFRGALETMTYIALSICFLLLVYISKISLEEVDFDVSFYKNICGLILKVRELITLSTVFVFGAGALMLYVLFFQTRLIPRWLSIWGIIAIVLHLATGFLLLFGLQTELSTSNTIMNFPIFLQEMVMAVWLISKGFDKNKVALLI